MTTTPTAAALVSGTDIDRAMLQSMETSFRAGIDLSFNRHDMAELLDRLAAIQPDPEPVAHHWKDVCRDTNGPEICDEPCIRCATPSSAGTVSVEAVSRMIDSLAPTMASHAQRQAALRALAGDGGSTDM